MAEQPKPQGKGAHIFPLVIADLRDREQKGIETYGESLRANNGRDSLRDAYEEALDLALYLKQTIIERDRPLDVPLFEEGGKFDFVGYKHSDIPNLGNFTRPGRHIGVHGSGAENPPVPDSVLQEAQKLVCGDRGESYGHPYEDMGRTGGMLTSLLADKLREGAVLNARDVSMMMICVKLSRERNSPKRDNRVDGPGYFLTLDMIMAKAKELGVDLTK
jgi:hypothetical protein